jgi:WD40 repeat protein
MVRVTHYDGFISYSHSADAPLARELQRAFHRMARPFYKARAMHVFRDETSLGATADLPGEIRERLRASDNFILVASPTAAGRPWIAQEVEQWLAEKPHERFFIALAAGEIAWDRAKGDFDWARTNSLPREIAGKLATEPFSVRFEGFKPSLDDRGFYDKAATLVAGVKGIDKGELDGEDLRQRRRWHRVRNSGIAMLAILVALAITFAVIARDQRDRARAQARLATSRQLAVEAQSALEKGQLDVALLLAVHADRVLDTAEARDVLLSAVERHPGLEAFLPGAPASAVAFGAGGRLAVGGRDGTVALWSTRTHRRLRVLEQGSGEGAQVAFAKRPLLVASGAKGKIVAWDLKTADALPKTIRPRGPLVQSLAVSADGNQVAVGSRYEVEIWSTGAGGDQRIEAKSIVNALQFLRDGVLAVGMRSGRVELWGLGHPGNRRVLAGGGSQVTSLAVSRNGQSLAWGRDDGTIVLFCLAHRSIAARFHAGTQAVDALAFQAPRGRLASLGRDGRLLLWDPRRPSRPHVVTTTARGLAVDVSADGRLLAVGSDAPHVELWRTAPSRPLVEGTLRGGFVAAPGLAWSADGSALAESSTQSRIVVRTGRMKQTFRPRRQPAGLAFPDDLLAVGLDGAVERWDHARPGASETLVSSQRGVTLAALSPGGDARAMLTGNGIVAVSDLRSGAPTSLWGRTQSTTALALAGKGGPVAAGQGDGSVVYWAGLRSHSRALRAPKEQYVQSVAFDRDGLLAVGNAAQTIALWDVRGEPRLLGHPLPAGTPVGALAFRPDGRLLASAGTDTAAISLWDVDVADWLRRACAVANRELSADEMTRYLGSHPLDTRGCA